LYLEKRISTAVSAGLSKSQIILDPGIGFGKTKEHNILLLKNVPLLKELGCPVLIGASMKRIVGDLTGKTDDDKLAGTIGLHLSAVVNGAHIIRVHHPVQCKDALICFNTVQNKGEAA
jgi:dihydropteroate synthase